MSEKRASISRLRRQEASWAYLFLLPAFLAILIFVYIPVINAVNISLHRWGGFGELPGEALTSPAASALSSMMHTLPKRVIFARSQHKLILYI